MKNPAPTPETALGPAMKNFTPAPEITRVPAMKNPAPAPEITLGGDAPGSSPALERLLSGSASASLRARLARALQNALARRSLAAFVLRTHPGYRMGWAHEEICSALDAFLDDVLARRSPRLMICMPPRHGKSELAARRFPAYSFGRFPDLSVISTSYAADLASRMNRDVQRIMDGDVYRALFPASLLQGASPAPGSPAAGRATRTPEPAAPAVSPGSRRTRSADLFELVGRAGSYRSAGVGGGITGMGADILILDDPFKNRAEADSPVVRRKVRDWYASTLYTRLAPGGGIVLINTRWHQDDLAGHLLQAQARGEGDVWKVIEFPAVAVADEPRRKAGEALHPERYPLERLRAIKAALGTRDWEALYQQRPAPDGGAIFKARWLRFWLPQDLPDAFDAVILSWDLTFKDGTDADFVVGQAWGRKGADRYLLDQVRRRMSFTQTLAAFRALSARWPAARRILVENAANGPAVVDALRHHIPGIVPVTPEGSKTARAHAVTALFEAGNVLLPHPDLHPWIADYAAELTQFPAAAHDDQVDATTQALRHMDAHGGLRLHEAFFT